MWKVSVLVLVALGCVAEEPLDEARSGLDVDWDGGPEDPSGEVIVVEGDPGWDAGWWFPGPGNEGTVQPPPLPPGGVGGGPGKQPARKDCTRETEHEQCYACCYYNLDHVDGWKCRKIKNPEKRKKCWSEAEEELGRCQRGCPRPAPVLTSSP